MADKGGWGDDGGGLSTGGLAGVIVVVVLVLGAIIAFSILLYFKNKRVARRAAAEAAAHAALAPEGQTPAQHRPRHPEALPCDNYNELFPDEAPARGNVVVHSFSELHALKDVLIRVEEAGDDRSSVDYTATEMVSRAPSTLARFPVMQGEGNDTAADHFSYASRLNSFIDTSGVGAAPQPQNASRVFLATPPMSFDPSLPGQRGLFGRARSFSVPNDVSPLPRGSGDGGKSQLPAPTSSGLTSLANEAVQQPTRQGEPPAAATLVPVGPHTNAVTVPPQRQLLVPMRSEAVGTSPQVAHTTSGEWDLPHHSRGSSAERLYSPFDGAGEQSVLTLGSQAPSPLRPLLLLPSDESPPPHVDARDVELATPLGLPPSGDKEGAAGTALSWSARRPPPLHRPTDAFPPLSPQHRRPTPAAIAAVGASGAVATARTSPPPAAVDGAGVLSGASGTSTLPQPLQRGKPVRRHHRLRHVDKGGFIVLEHSLEGDVVTSTSASLEPGTPSVNVDAASNAVGDAATNSTAEQGRKKPKKPKKKRFYFEKAASYDVYGRAEYAPNPQGTHGLDGLPGESSEESEEAEETEESSDDGAGAGVQRETTGEGASSSPKEVPHTTKLPAHQDPHRLLHPISPVKPWPTADDPTATETSASAVPFPSERDAVQPIPPEGEMLAIPRESGAAPLGVGLAPESRANDNETDTGRHWASS